MNPLKLLALAGGGYLLYTNWDAIAALLPSAGARGTVGVPPPSAPAESSTPAPAPAVQVPTTYNARAEVLRQAKASFGTENPVATWDQWNYFFQRVRGVSAGNFETTGLNSRDYRMSIDEFWSTFEQIQAAGLAGLAVRTGWAF